MFQAAYARGYGTLYADLYRPRSLTAELVWPGHRWQRNEELRHCDDVREGQFHVAFGDPGYSLYT
ncbi:hypothetical protein FJU30_15130 [Affinibrenneria salicis]|uniref:Uncharacterized protein n=1 Tax=Affinibrenneria salicis TaxID=2590031 RepID=A0A5J5FY16_9GAMM|nr:hypothetical protein [Affinibrenneria salicis]KAA8999005.1 hypothetical protein FJU30_15130 [Affinibrenneria salicis]